MSVTATKSPRYFSGPVLSKMPYTAVDSQTWKAGEWATMSSTGKVLPVSRGSTRILGIFADSQSSATSSSAVKVFKVTSTKTQFVGYVSNAANDTTAQTTHIGEVAGIYSGSNVQTVNVGNDTKTVFTITGRLCDVEPFKNASTDNPGQLIFRIKNDSVLL